MALNMKMLYAQLLAAWQRSGGSPKDTTVPAEEEQRLVKELYEQRRKMLQAPTSAEKPGASATPPTIEEMKRELAGSMPADEAGLRTLAQQRAEAVRESMVGDGKLSDDRVYLTDVDLTVSGQELVQSRLNITAGP